MDATASVDQRAFTVNHRIVLSIAVPMTLAYLSTPLLGIVDTAVIGQLGDAALIGGVAVGAIIFDIVFTTFNFLRSGTTGLTAQALGAGDDKERTAVLARALLLAFSASLIVLLFSVPLLELSLALMQPSAAVGEATSDYFAVRVLGTPFSLANYAILGWFLGLGRAGTGLLLQTLLNGLNMVLNATFVLGLGWGIAGVAWGTVIGEAVTMIVGGALALRLLSGDALPSRARIFDRLQFLRMAAVNRDIMIRSFTLMFAFAFMTAQGARQGDIVLAANAVLMNFFLLGGYFLDGFATAAEQLCGRAVGARHAPAFRQAVRLTMIWGFVLAFILLLILLAFGGLFIDVMTVNEEVRAAARDYLIWAALTPLLGVLAFQMDGVFIGATWSRDMRNMMLASLALYLLTWWIAMPLYGNHGLWFALNVFLSARGVLLYAVMLRRGPETFGRQAWHACAD